MNVDINAFLDALTRVNITKLPYVDTILDIGSGACPLATQYPYMDTKITFTDIQNSDFNKFDEAKKTMTGERFRFVYTSADDLSMFEDDSFDMVTNIHVIEHLTTEQQTKMMLEISRVLKKDGLLVLSTPTREGRKLVNKYKANSGHIEEYSYAEISKLLTGNNFKCININRGIIYVDLLLGKVKISPECHNEPEKSYAMWLLCKNMK